MWQLAAKLPVMVFSRASQRKYFSNLNFVYFESMLTIIFKKSQHLQ